MINKVGYKLLWALWICYTLTLMAYLFLVVNVLSHPSCVSMLLFAIISIIIDFWVLTLPPKGKSTPKMETISDISVITLLYTLMQFFTVVWARNILDMWQYALCQGLILALYLFSTVPRLLKK